MLCCGMPICSDWLRCPAWCWSSQIRPLIPPTRRNRQRQQLIANSQQQSQSVLHTTPMARALAESIKAMPPREKNPPCKPSLRASSDGTTPPLRDTHSPLSSPPPESSPGFQIACEPTELDGKHGGTDFTSNKKENRLSRHRESCRKSYNKKMTTISSLKDQLDALEATFSALLPHQREQGAAASQGSPLLAAYAELARVRCDLVRENEHLYQRNAASMTLEGRLQQVLDVDAPSAVSERPFAFVPLDASVAARILAAARDDVLRFAHSRDKLSLRASVFGWTDYRQVRENELKFALEKRFPSLTARELVDRTWRVVSCERQCARLFNPSLQASFEILQHVADDTLLVYRTIHADVLGVTAKTVFLLSRVRIPEGFLVLFRSIDPRLIAFDDGLVNQVIEDARKHSQQLFTGPSKARQRRDMWVDKYAWGIAFDDGPHSCRFQFGGSTMSNVWLKEVLFVALQWEKMTVGPAFLLDV